ncbi:MAG: ISKra4 family transposase [bacterium]|nr:ISKra4 family transposase [bacterium]
MELWLYVGDMETQNYFRQAEEQFSTMRQFLQSDDSQHLDLSGLEEFLFSDGRTLLRHLLLAHLAERGVGDIGASVQGADGVNRTQKRLRRKTLKTLFGPIEIWRLGYSKPQVSSVFPLDAMLNLPHGHISYALQRHVVLEIINNPFHESLHSIFRWTGVTITNAQAQQIILDAAHEFASFYQHRVSREAEKAQSLPLLILTADGKGVVMKTQDLRPATRQRALRKARVKTKPRSKAEHQYAKRMATVASVYEIERYRREPSDIVTEFFSATKGEKKKAAHQRPRPSAKRLWASLQASGKSVISDIFQEALQRDEHHTKQWVVLVDGDLNQITQFQQLAQTWQLSVTIVCDMIHVLGYLWKAGKVLRSKDEIDDWVSQKLQEILEGKSRQVAAGIRRSATCRHLAKSTRKPADVCARYLTNHSPYLAYDEYLQQGYPIATGVIEGGCRYLVKDRMEITGARWSLKGAEAVLKLRAIKVSGDFDAYWKFYEQTQYEKKYRRLYKDPSFLQPKNVSEKSGFAK